MNDQKKEELLSFVSGGGYVCSFGTPASELTSFRVGGPVFAVIYPESKGALCALLRFLREREYRHSVLGFGSNVLAPDEGYDGVLVVTSRVAGVSVDGCVMTAECGKGVTACASAAQRVGLSGFEFAYGIPGSVGGAVFMNAGAYGSEIKDIIIDAECFDAASGETVTLTREELALGYRDSALRRNGMTALSARFSLTCGDRDAIAEKMAELMARRREKQPLDLPSAGSIFKRAPGHFTGKLIEDCGLKGTRVGGAVVSEKHAGFIVNAGGATSNDVKTLVGIVEERVMRQFGVALERELIYL